MGSEMCIRDRKRIKPRRKPKKKVKIRASSKMPELPQRPRIMAKPKL